MIALFVCWSILPVESKVTPYVAAATKRCFQKSRYLRLKALGQQRSDNKVARANLGKMMWYLLLFLSVYSTTLVEINGFCSRPYDHPDWEPQTIEQRSQDADIIIYAEVIDSPCHKPEPLTTTTTTTTPAPTTAATLLEKIGLGNLTTNESLSSNYTNPLLSTTTVPPTTTLAPTTTAIPTTVPGRNCSFGSYNASLRIHCVIKGGAIPEYINLDELGIGNDTCVFRHLNETEHEFHAYHGRNYTIFLKRKHNIAREDSFTLHTINVQPATNEITNVTFLKPIFKVAGRHAHAAMGVWVNKTDPICKPYSGATSFMLFSLTSAVSMGLMSISTYFLC